MPETCSTLVKDTSRCVNNLLQLLYDVFFHLEVPSIYCIPHRVHRTVANGGKLTAPGGGDTEQAGQHQHYSLLSIKQGINS